MKFLAFIAGVTLLVLSIGVALRAYAGSDPAMTRAVADDGRPPDALLSQRLAIAYAALRNAEGARRLPEVHRYALVGIDAIVGPEGRHGRAAAPPGGVLPADGERIQVEPGLALRAYESLPPGSPLRTALEGAVIGDVAGWQDPRGRYDAIDRAVAAYRPDNDTVSVLPSETERALAWSLLTLRTEDVRDAHAVAGRAAHAARQALDAVRAARAASR